MDQDRPKEVRNWLWPLTRLAHMYFAVSRGMTLGVRAACFDYQGRVFLVRHSYLPGWHLPGGGVDRHETAFDGLVRELREEGNLELTGPPRLVQVYYNPGTSKRDHVVFFRCDDVRQVRPKVADLEIAAAGFFAPDDLPADTTPATRRRLAELAGTAAPAMFW
ncbi:MULTISPECIES: NUDIX domain-containing protein [Sinorhizobium]|uniref:DNA mismatch repair protein MutT n=1 Tax=Sinorhizobium americanum TaxID=194963 RepID=A0A2S3YMC3_9HYPH|nr:MULTISPECIES: NUDIX domain-containing protein [Sinorhizobium]PDT42303.1 DNA mismatch repair protein MutT [Sinorhizobium sp. FG01]POH30222.1 DNA mismatch repair protein MutT [Sinorhizobium americanum]